MVVVKIWVVLAALAAGPLLLAWLAIGQVWQIGSAAGSRPGRIC